MHDGEADTDADLVQRLVRGRFPQWADLPVERLVSGGTVNAVYRLGGALTALPLIAFAYAVRRIPFTVVGLLQYIAPTLQLLCGVLVLHEPFGRERAIGFVLIWISLALYAGDGLVRAHRAVTRPT